MDAEEGQERLRDEGKKEKWKEEREVELGT